MSYELENETHFETTLGSYSQLFLKIKVGLLYDEKHNEQRSHYEFHGPEIAIFFHEFIHHIQNISSIIGLSHLDSTISFWHNVRNCIEDHSDENSLNYINLAFKNIKHYRINNDRNKKIHLPKIISIEEVHHNSVDLEPIIIKLKEDESDIEIKFGIAEFFESSAYSLEQFFRRQVNIANSSDETPAIPYKIGESIGKYYNPNLSEKTLIMLMLTALQHGSPHKAYITLAKQFSTLDLRDDDAHTILADHTASLIKSNSKWMEGVINQIKSEFPLKDPVFGDLVIELFESSKEMIERRISQPFAELVFLNNVKPDNLSQKLTEFINLFGGCLVYRDTGLNGSEENPENKSFAIGGDLSIFKNSRGWDVFQTSIHYSLLHIRENHGDIIVSSPVDNAKCPIFLTCSHGNKKSEMVKCTSRPWQHETAKGDGNDCAYQLAVFKACIANSPTDLTRSQ
ncbi:hypothetical protein AB6D30_08730 [Pectobacterium brasiliense]|uniref:hypothetical protein n=1 Tax=Pectobacterium brasiliense TaxID=180957 RepID=UPI0019812A65|nr:hypothetical protein [Pectobacterium brasiliense]